MTPKELYQKLKSKDELLLVDVREPFEYNICKFEDSLHIPLVQVVARIGEIPKEKETVILCHHGIRSALVVDYLKKNGFEMIHNLDGGIHQWAVDIEPDMAKY